MDLYNLAWDEKLDKDSELPLAFMPKEYLVKNKLLMEHQSALSLISPFDASLFKKLTLSSQCSPEPNRYRVWKITNLNSYNILVRWHIDTSSQKDGSNIVPATVPGKKGELIFYTATEQGLNVVRIYARGEQQDVKVSFYKECD